MRRIAYKIFTFLLISAILFSCSKENTNFGTITFDINPDVNVSVNNNTTKASSVNTDNFEVFLNENSLGLKKDLTAPVIVAPGTYSVWAQSCSDQQANTSNGLLRFYGKTDNIVVEDQSDITVTVNCKVVNSKISISLDDSYNNYFDSGFTTVTVSDGNRTLTIIQNGSPTTDAVYFDANKTITIKVNSKKTSANGTPHIVETTQTITSVAATWHKIAICVDLNLSGGITFTTQDSHVNDWISISDYIPGSVEEDN